MIFELILYDMSLHGSEKSILVGPVENPVRKPELSHCCAQVPKKPRSRRCFKSVGSLNATILCQIGQKPRTAQHFRQRAILNPLFVPALFFPLSVNSDNEQDDY